MYMYVGGYPSWILDESVLYLKDKTNTSKMNPVSSDIGWQTSGSAESNLKTSYIHVEQDFI